jgi:hypothetical protein
MSALRQQEHEAALRAFLFAGTGRGVGQRQPEGPAPSQQAMVVDRAQRLDGVPRRGVTGVGPADMGAERATQTLLILFVVAEVVHGTESRVVVFRSPYKWCAARPAADQLGGQALTGASSSAA